MTFGAALLAAWLIATFGLLFYTYWMSESVRRNRHHDVQQAKRIANFGWRMTFFVMGLIALTWLLSALLSF